MAKCPICNKNNSNKKELLNHIENKHKAEIPNNMSVAQYVYSLNHNGRDYGLCRICGKPTPWNEKTGKPKQICGSQSCKDKISKEFEINLKNKRNLTRYDLMNDPKHQQEMLANRKISGVYKWSDNKHQFTYTGTYEKFALEWLDTVMDIDPDTIQTPGPEIQYTYNGKSHYWITDMYLTDYNLVIEIKDGGKTGDKNTHPGFAHNRELEKAKDDYMRKQNKYNYLKLTNKNMMQLVKILSEIRVNNIFSKDDKDLNTKPFININESSIITENISILPENNNNKKIKIGIDIDNTMTDIQERVIQEGMKWCEKHNKNIDNIDRTKPSPKEIFNLNDKENEIFFKDIGFNILFNALPSSDCSDVINRLHDNYEINIITARYEQDDVDIIKLTKDWLSKYEIPYDNIYFSINNKGEFCKNNGIHIMIDDNVNEINSCIENNVFTIAPVRLYNKELNNYENCQYCNNWFDIENAVNDISNLLLSTSNIDDDDLETTLESILIFNNYQLNESITLEKLSGSLKELYLKIVSYIKDIYRKWQGIKFVNVSKEEKICIEKILDKSKELANDLVRVLETDHNLSYETKYELFLSEIKKYKKVRKNKDKTEQISIDKLHDTMKYLENIFNKSIKSTAKFSKKYKAALWIVISRTMYVINTTLYKTAGKGHGGRYLTDKQKGIVSKRYGKTPLTIKLQNLSKSELTDKLDKMRKSTSYSSYKKIFDEICEENNKPNISALKLLDLKNHDKLLFIGYNRLKPMKLKAGTKLYHYSNCSTIKALNPVYKCRDDITFFSHPRVYFTDKLMNSKKVLLDLKNPSIYEYTVKTDMIAYRDSEYGSWYHHCLYVETETPLKVKDITEEVMNKTYNENISINNIDIYDYILTEDVSSDSKINSISTDIVKNNHDAKKIKKDISNLEKYYNNLSNNEKVKQLVPILSICKKCINIVYYMTGIGFVMDGTKKLDENRKLMRVIKKEMPMNHETYIDIRKYLDMKDILKVILGILIIVLNVIVITKIVSKKSYIIIEGIESIANKIMEKNKKPDINNYCGMIIKNISKIKKAFTLNESVGYIDLFDNTDNEYNYISNNEINTLSESIYNKDNILLEVSNNKTKNIFSTYDMNKSSWKDILFSKNDLIKKLTSIFYKVEVNKNNHTIEIRGINYSKLLDHVKELYDKQKVYKIFHIIYNPKDYKLYENRKINKSAVKIEYVQTYEFFALELTVLFNELYDKYKLKYYKNIAIEIYNKTWLSNSDIITPDKIDTHRLNLLNEKYTLKPYQREFIESYPKLKAKLNLDGYILSFDQGLGKTLTAVSLALCLRKERIYIVCPNALKENWALEIKEYFPKYENNEELWKQDVYIDGISKNYNKDAKFVIVNQESIPRIFDKIIADKAMLIVDESHNFRNINSKRSENLIKLKDMLKTKDVLVMSGTPIKASPNEICPALRLIDPLFNDDVAQIYNRCFNIDKILSSDIIQVRFGKIIYRKTKDEVLKLPNKNIDTIKFKVSDEEKYYVSTIRTLVKNRAMEIFELEYKNIKPLKDEFHEIIDKYTTAPAYVTKKYYQIVDNHVNTYDLDERDANIKRDYVNNYVIPNMDDKQLVDKLNLLIKTYVNKWQHCMGLALGEILYPRRKELFMKLFDENKSIITNMIHDNIKKTIIFTPIVDVANRIHKSLGESGLSSVLVTGGTKDKLTPILRFKEDSKIDVLVATSQTLGTGVTLTEANLMLFFGTPWRQADFNQCCDRIYRIGQTNDVYIYNILMESDSLNLSGRMENILNWSGEMFDSFIVSTTNENINIENLNEINNPDVKIVNNKNLDESNIMSISNLSPILNTGLFEELQPNKENENFDEQLEILKKSLTENIDEDNIIVPTDYCPEKIDFDNIPEDRFLLNRVKSDIVNNNIVDEYVNSHYGTLYTTSDLHIFGVWDKDNNNNNATNIQQVNKIIDNINNTVKEDDTLIICGDLGYKLDDCLYQHTKYFLSSIKCKHIWLVLGNHDLLTNDQYKEFGCEIVCDRLNYNGILFTHYPVNHSFNIHGHLHNEKIDNKYGYEDVDTDNKLNVFYWSKGDIGNIINLSDFISKYHNEYPDKFENNDNDIINEEAIYDNLHKYPIFITLMHSGTSLANAIKKFTKDEFSHACISLNSDLSPLYSFGRKKVDLLSGTGFCTVSPDHPFFKKFKSVYSVYVMYMNKDEYDKLKLRLDYFIKNKDNFKYDIFALLLNAMNIPSEFSKKYFCSKFVADIINSGRKLDKYPSLYRPNDFAYRSDITLVNKGIDFSKYNKNITDANLEYIKKGMYDKIAVNESIKDSDVIFGNGEYSSITDNRFTDFQTGSPFNQNEDIEPYTAMFSPNNDKPVKDYFDASNNFEVNEDVRIDMEIDPSNTGSDDLGSIAQSIYDSNFD